MRPDKLSGAIIGVDVVGRTDEEKNLRSSFPGGEVVVKSTDGGGG